ncbi:hypothetical protein AA23498_1292 [Acetobacter nitrogenifigens DSM 23921 = NBRC 105050]|uniref:Twin-arginine translocation signal domain-containing protein n=1 Tax=Acetobacter nitrogenifigens DSM 23921 = NBRC 105050 TaxID=1120919 RepID=A0A511XD02_9PROT|nr:hypothetical protein [Acetobacter nitrogenifigens]GBQ91837.1 hypothetical protein AA23498_1292 [Acetobacter nitrogenifigens DSM 23921 = NBRC 105050]GEN60755.1 hypothetical protein ANI02nite_26390 [Acetobacter nitrogenifigens DSM 23921 = NBRC 105050]
MSNFSRRSFLRNSALVGAALTAAACTVTTTGGVTAITLNVAKLQAYGQAGLNGAATIVGLAAGVASLTPYLPAIEVGETALAAALTAFSSAAGATVTITYDDTNWKTRVDSLFSDLSTVASSIDAAIQGAGSALSTTVRNDATMALNALETVIALFRALLSGASAGATPMSEPQALRVLGVAL